MELKSLSGKQSALSNNSSNRTFMELKLLLYLLILFTTETSSNRTFMELKSYLDNRLSTSGIGSNRTFMELK